MKNHTNLLIFKLSVNFIKCTTGSTKGEILSININIKKIRTHVTSKKDWSRIKNCKNEYDNNNSIS